MAFLRQRSRPTITYLHRPTDLLQRKKKARLTHSRGIHTLRHCFATHLLQQGVDIYEIKRLLGHSSIKTTYQYIHLTTDWRAKIISPLELLDEVQ